MATEELPNHCTVGTPLGYRWDTVAVVLNVQDYRGGLRRGGLTTAGGSAYARNGDERCLV